MTKLIILLFLATFCFGSIGWTQRKIVMIDQAKMEKKAHVPQHTNNVHVFKFSPFQMISGELNFGYERKISKMKRGSMEFEIGPTISEIGTTPSNSTWVPYFCYRQESKLGFFLGTAFRYYLMEETEAPNRWYVSPALKFRIFNTGYSAVSGNVESMKGRETHLNFTFNTGYQLWLQKNFSLDAFFGAGIGMFDENSYQLSEVWEGEELVSSWIQSTSSYPRYIFTFGVKVGIGME